MGKRILFLSNHFITLYSFRTELIQKLLTLGHEVYISTPEDKDNVYFSDMGCKIVLTPIDRRGVNPLKDIKLLVTYKRIIRQINPDIIYSYTIKPNIYGSIISNFLGYKQVCNITGTGATFLKKTFVNKVAKMLYRVSVKKTYKVFFQNTGDKDLFVNKKMVGDNWEILPGSGVNLKKYTLTPLTDGNTIRFIFIGRVMKLKGIDEYLSCAERIKAKYPNTEFVIAGWNEEKKYKKLVQKYHDAGIVNYIGFRKDIEECIKKCHCTVLPSHGGEGIPNVLLETAATGRACIASSINGSKDVVDDGITGYIFKPGNIDSLVSATEKFIALPLEKKVAMGLAGRAKVENEFDREIVIQKYLDELYQAKERA